MNAKILLFLLFLAPLLRAQNPYCNLLVFPSNTQCDDVDPLSAQRIMYCEWEVDENGVSHPVVNDGAYIHTSVVRYSGSHPHDGVSGFYPRPRGYFIDSFDINTKGKTNVNGCIFKNWVPSWYAGQTQFDGFSDASVAYGYPTQHLLLNQHYLSTFANVPTDLVVNQTTMSVNYDETHNNLNMYVRIDRQKNIGTLASTFYLLGQHQLRLVRIGLPSGGTLDDWPGFQLNILPGNWDQSKVTFEEHFEMFSLDIENPTIFDMTPEDSDIKEAVQTAHCRPGNKEPGSSLLVPSVVTWAYWLQKPLIHLDCIQGEVE